MAKKSPTKAEKLRLQTLTDLGCIVCFIQGQGYSAPEIHHLRHGMGMGQRNSHFKAIGLCPKHHRIGGYGIALHAGQKKFETNYGTETELLEQTEKLLLLI